MSLRVIRKYVSQNQMRPCENYMCCGIIIKWRFCHHATM